MDDIEYFYARQAIGRIVAHPWGCVMGKLTGHPIVDAIAQINFEGDITPKSWYKHIRYQNKKSGERADHLAVAILADIVYWYRPFQKRDEITGEVIGWFKKFKGDVLHRSPDAFAEALGTTTRCIRESIRLLENLGLIVVVLKPVRTQYGTIPNVMHIEIVPDAIAKITYRSASTEIAESIEKSLLTKWVTSNDEISNKQLRNREQPVTKSPSVITNSVSQSHDFDNSSIDIDFSEINKIGKESSHTLAESNLNSKDPNTEIVASLITKSESSGKQITPHEDGYSARPLQSIYAQAANVWELVDLCLDSPDLADAKPPSELLAVYNEKYKWNQWRWPWRSLNKTREFGTFNPDVVIKLAKKLASEEKGAILEQKYQYAINILSNWEQTKGGWEKMIGYCDRPVDQNIAESAKEVTEIPKHIQGWHDSYHEILHEKFRAARSLEAFFKKDKDNEPWYRFAKEKFPSWDWSK